MEVSEFFLKLLLILLAAKLFAEVFSRLSIPSVLSAKGPLLAEVSLTHAVTGHIAVLMTGVAIASLTFRIEKKAVLRLGWAALAMIMAYVVNIYLLYALRVAR
jgi:Kef-type K+ transport system membrane component KefB